MKCFMAAISGAVAGQSDKSVTDLVKRCSLVATEAVREVRRLSEDPKHLAFVRAE